MTRSQIFCLEGDWETRLESKLSVRPLLDLLSGVGVAGGVVHRDVATRAELEHYVARLARRSVDTFPVVYLAFHGFAEDGFGYVSLGGEDVSLDELADVFGSESVAGRVIYTGSCSTLDVTDDALRDFCKRTGVRGLLGYSKDVGWVESAAFDILLLDELLRAAKLKPMMARLRKQHARFVEGLGLTIATERWVERGLGSAAAR